MRKVHVSAAEKQKAYRQRQEIALTDLDALVEALVHAFDRSGCHRVVDNLPEDRHEKVVELIERINAGNLVRFRFKDPDSAEELRAWWESVPAEQREIQEEEAKDLVDRWKGEQLALEIA